MNRAFWPLFFGGGGKSPAASSSIVQWLNGLESDGLTLVDRKDVVNPEPEYRDVNCLDFDGTKVVETDVTNQTGNWFIDMWIKPTTYAHTHEVVSLLTTSSVRPLYILTSGRVQVRVNGTSYTSGASNIVPLNEWSRVVSKRVSGVITVEAYESDGTPRFSEDIGTDSTVLNTGFLVIGGRVSGTPFEGQMGYTLIEDSLTFPFEEGSGLPFDVSGNGNDATAITATWTTADGITSWNHGKGFKVAVQSTPPYIPALADGSLAADGGAITNPGGFVHNGSEVTLIQTDADETVFGGSNVWGDGVATWDKVSYADFLALPNGEDNVWMKWVSVNGACHLKEIATYLETKVFTPAESLKNLKWAGGSGCGAVLAYVLAGYVDSGYVL